MATFIQMVTKIAGDLRRSNLTTEIKAAINDAITEASNTRFWFNEVEIGDTLPSGAEYTFTDPFPLTEIDYVHVIPPVGNRYEIYPINSYDYWREKANSTQVGRPEYYTTVKGRLRIWPMADQNYSLVVGGSSQNLSPLVSDASTSVWLVEGELYIRALAKRNILRDVIRDYGEAAVLDKIAEGYKQQLVEETASRTGATGTLTATQF